MLTKLTLRNFKRFPTAEISLAQPVVFVGPNNSGKTTALQALALWHVGLKTWFSRRQGKARPEKRPGVTINRRDLTSLPVPTANLLWHELHVRDVEKANGKQRTKNVRIDVVVEGVIDDQPWTCGLEFDYSNEESFYCRPLRVAGFDDVQVKDAKFAEPPDVARKVKVAYLPPMSGLADREFQKQRGEIDFLIGQGQTAQVLRNLCLQVRNEFRSEVWEAIVKNIRDLFGATLREPHYVAERSEIVMDYEERGSILDLSSAGRGMQQTLLLLTYLYSNPFTALLLDEPDAHLEVLRQRQTYRLIADVASAQGSQIIAATHSEVVLNEAAGTGTVVAFVGLPHVINDRGTQLLKSLTDIGWEQYFQAEQTGWILFLEGQTDLAILQAFAASLDHPAQLPLERPFVHYVGTNLPQKARDLFFGLKEARPDLVGIAIFDRLTETRPLRAEGPLVELQWSRREVENYLCEPDVLIAFARGRQPDLFSAVHERAMRESIGELEAALRTLGREPWSHNIKATDDFLEPLFRRYFEKLGLPLTFRKTQYHELAGFIPPDKIDTDVMAKLDAIVETANRARPAPAP